VGRGWCGLERGSTEDRGNEDENRKKVKLKCIIRKEKEKF